MSYTHANRDMKLTTPLGGDELLLTGFRGQEHISSPFSLELDLLSFNPGVSPADLLRKPATVSLLLPDGSTRYFNGLISRFQCGLRGASGMTAYRATLVPWFWFLRLTSDCRIFQNLSTQQIVSQVFDELGFGDYSFRGLTAGQEPREYCVQYRESAFNFVSRLLEEEGIFYFFEHREDKHVMVIADASLQFPPCPGPSQVGICQPSDTRLEDDVIHEVLVCDEVQSGRVALADFNFEMPSTRLPVQIGDMGDEVFDYPGIYVNRSLGDARARVRLEQHLSAIQHLQGSSGCRAFTAGHHFSMKDFYRTDIEPRQALRSVIHDVRQPLEGTDDASGSFQYRNSYVSFPYSASFRPPRAARRPFVSGSQTAIVVGPAGEEIWCDSYGRVKVQFHWDRRGGMDENSSCWVRVAHNWAGKSWGAICIPRIGQEVIVDFLEGDPDRPIIIGRVYNADQMPPYTLPGEQTKSTIKSNSSRGGGGFNELRFEDRKGGEEIFLHGQKDWTIKILNDKNEEIDHDETLTVGHNRVKTVRNDQSETVRHNKSIQVVGTHTETIDSDKTLTVGGTHTETIQGDKTLTVNANHTETIARSMTISIGSSLTETIALNYAETVGLAMELTVGGMMAETVGAARVLSVGASLDESVGLNRSATVGGELTTRVGRSASLSAGGDVATSAGQSVSISAGKTVTLEAADEIVLKTGSASIVMKKNGDVTIKGAKLTLEGSGDVVIKGSKIAQN